MMNLNIQTVPFALGVGILTTHTCTCVEHDVYCNRYFLFNHLCMYVLHVFLDLLVCTSCVHDMLCIYLFLCVNLFAYTFAY